MSARRCSRRSPNAGVSAMPRPSRVRLSLLDAATLPAGGWAPRRRRRGRMPGRRSVVEKVTLQVPAPFDYERATIVEHGIARLEELGPGARLLARRLQIFTDAERVIADPVVRSRGTIGGALCQADPSEDLSAVCAAVGARMVIRGRAGERGIGMNEFHRGPYQTAVEPAEMLVEIRVPLRGGSGSAYEKVDRRAGDWAVV